MSTYQLGRGWVTRIDDGLSIPFDPANMDYQQYLTWLAEGNTPLPYVDTGAGVTAGSARSTRIEARTQAQARKLARRGDALGALKLLNHL